MSKLKLIAKVIEKLSSSKPKVGTFYIVDGKIIYSTFEGGIPFKSLWKKSLSQLFQGLHPDNLSFLQDHPFAADRGQVSWSGKYKDGTPSGEGEYTISGTKGIKEYIPKIKQMFGIDDVIRDVNIDLDGSQFKINPLENKTFNAILEAHPIALKSNLFVASN